MFKQLRFLEKVIGTVARPFFFYYQQLIKMIIKIIMGLFIALLLVNAAYLWHCRHGRFLIFDAQADAYVARTLTFTSLSLFGVSIIGLCLLFAHNRYLNFITLILAMLVILLFGFLLRKKE